MLLRDLVIAGICSAVLYVSPAFAEATVDFGALYQNKVTAETTGSTEKTGKTVKKTAEKEQPERAKVVKVDAAPSAPRTPLAKQTVLPTVDVAVEGNNGELRSSDRPRGGFFKTIFGEDAPRYLPETQTLDGRLAAKTAGKPFKVKSDYEPQTVAFSGYSKGTIVVDTKTRYLYLVESGDTARRYAIAVGKEGLAFKGTATVGDKQEWPRWFPTKDMQEREPKKYGPYKDGMNGGPENPLGARAIYLYQGRTDTHIRIHGTNAPQTIGSASSNGCFRMINEHVMDLYNRVPMGTQVVVL